MRVINERMRVINERGIGLRAARVLDLILSQRFEERLLREMWRVDRRLLARQKLEQQPPMRFDIRRVSFDVHAIGQRRRARGKWLRGTVHAHQAQAASAVGMQPLVVAQARHLDAQPAERLKNRQAFRDLARLAIDGYPRHRSSSDP